MKKINTLILLIATIGLVSLTGYASTNFEPGYGFHFHYGAGFGGFGGMDHGFFSHFGPYGGFGGGMTPGMGFGSGMFSYMDTFGSFARMDFDGRKHNSVRKIVPIPATASAASSITFDESGEIHVRPFDDEDLFVED